MGNVVALTSQELCLRNRFDGHCDEPNWWTKIYRHGRNLLFNGFHLISCYFVVDIVTKRPFPFPFLFPIPSCQFHIPSQDKQSNLVSSPP